MSDNFPQSQAFPHYSANPQAQQTIAKLQSLGCPAIPVAPKQYDPTAHISGKNPSYIDQYGNIKICKHGQFQNRMPTDDELRLFFNNPNTGVGTLGGWGGIVWLDFDRKCYPTQEACDADFNRIVALICAHTGCQRQDLWFCCKNLLK